MLNDTKLIDKSTTQTGMIRTISERPYTNYKGEQKTVREISAEFKPEHPMRKKYGLTKLRSSYYPEGGRFYRLQADVFGNKIEYETNNLLRGKKGNIDVAAFLKNLAHVQNYKPTKFLERIISVAKYIK